MANFATWLAADANRERGDGDVRDAREREPDEERLPAKWKDKAPIYYREGNEVIFKADWTRNFAKEQMNVYHSQAMSISDVENLFERLWRNLLFSRGDNDPTDIDPVNLETTDDVFNIIPRRIRSDTNSIIVFTICHYVGKVCEWIIRSLPYLRLYDVSSCDRGT